MNPLIRIAIVHEDGFRDEVRVRAATIAEATRIALDPATHDFEHGDVTHAHFVGYVDEER